VLDHMARHTPLAGVRLLTGTAPFTAGRTGR
jgi:hypothetical protein